MTKTQLTNLLIGSIVGILVSVLASACSDDVRSPVAPSSTVQAPAVQHGSTVAILDKPRGD